MNYHFRKSRDRKRLPFFRLSERSECCEESQNSKFSSIYVVMVWADHFRMGAYKHDVVVVAYIHGAYFL